MQAFLLRHGSPEVLIHYVLRPGRLPEILVNRTTPRIKRKYCLHLGMSAAPLQRLSSGEWIQSFQLLMEELVLPLAEHSVLVVRHNNASIDHIHATVNLIRDNGEQVEIPSLMALNAGLTKVRQSMTSINYSFSENISI